MSTRTRSSARKQALQNHVDDQSTGSHDHETNQSFILEDKEQEIWDEIREEHYDIIEQLPLTIHRQLTLLCQIDRQSRRTLSSMPTSFDTLTAQNPSLFSEYSDTLLPAVRQYIELRERLVQSGNRLFHPAEADGGPSPQSPFHDGRMPIQDATVSASIDSQTKTISNPNTTRKLLSHIARLSEEYLRTSREKVNIAQTTQDSVDRHIRLLDQFIKEQEASLGPEPNAPVMLSMSELVVPKWSRPTRVSMSPMPDEQEEQALQLLPNEPEVSLPSDHSGKRRSQKGRKNKEKEKEKDDHSTAPPLRITLPPHPDIYIDPNEPTWCYCNRISFGEMIGCDDPECKYEWFHLECVGLKEVPEDDEWYCRECSQRRESKSRRK